MNAPIRLKAPTLMETAISELKAIANDEKEIEDRL